MWNNDQKWGLLRETKVAAEKAGIDKDIGIKRSGLEDYLAVIFPDVTDWVHNKGMDDLPKGVKNTRRPDYRSKSKKIIIEFDGLGHYKDPNTILDDEKKDEFYRSIGYKVVRIPYFIQLTNKAVETMFGVVVNEPLFNEKIPSMGPEEKNTPAFLCYAGIRKMAKIFKNFPDQYDANVAFLKECDNEFLTGVNILESEYLRNEQDSV